MTYCWRLHEERYRTVANMLIPECAASSAPVAPYLVSVVKTNRLNKKYMLHAMSRPNPYMGFIKDQDSSCSSYGSITMFTANQDKQMLMCSAGVQGQGVVRHEVNHLDLRQARRIAFAKKG
jgi:hypothetical protein